LVFDTYIADANMKHFVVNTEYCLKITVICLCSRSSCYVVILVLVNH